MDRSTSSFIDSQIKIAKIFVVSKTSCKACKKAKKLLNQLVMKTGTFPSVFEIDTLDRKSKKALIKYLFGKTGIKTVPQIWINGRFVGGNDDIQRLQREGRLVTLIRMRINSSQSGTGTVFPNRSPSPSITSSVKSAPTPIRVGKGFITGSSYGRQRAKSVIPVGFTNSIVIPEATVLPGKFSNVYGDEKWDMPMRNLEPKSNYVVDQPPIQLQRNSYLGDGSRSRSLAENSGWSLTSAPTQYSFPVVQESNWIASPGDFSGSAPIVMTPGGSRSKILSFDGTVEITGWI